MRTIQLSLGAVLIDGKTAAAEVEAIDKQCLERERHFLDGWAAKFDEMYPGEDRPHIPDSAGIDWHRLAGGGSGMQDASNQAQAMSRLIEDKVREVYRAKIGEEAWGAMTEEEQHEATRFHRTFCHNHLRCTCIRHAMKFEDKYLKPILAASLKDFKPDLRISDKIDNVFRAAVKEFLYQARASTRRATACSSSRGSGSATRQWSSSSSSGPTSAPARTRPPRAPSPSS